MKDKQQRIWGVLFCGSAVILGAFGAHLLETMLSEEVLRSYEVGVRYQFFHGLALLFIGQTTSTRRGFRTVALFFVIGTLLFSGSIYGLSLGSISATENTFRFLGPVTPLGGTLLIIGWACLLVEYIRR